MKKKKKNRKNPKMVGKKGEEWRHIIDKGNIIFFNFKDFFQLEVVEGR